MRFRLDHYYIPYTGEWTRRIEGSVHFDSQGNRHFKPEHMSQMCSERYLIQYAEAQQHSDNECVASNFGEPFTDWKLDIFYDKRDLSNLLNKLRPIHPRELFPMRKIPQ